MTKNATRRKFLSASGAAIAAGWAGAKLYAAEADAKPGPNETINLGLIGCGARGSKVMSSFMKAPGARVIAVCDYSNFWPSFGSPPDCDPPKELDWNFYVGPAPYRPYNPNIYYDYGYDWFKLSGGGHQVAWGLHQYDIMLWAMGVKWPVAVSAMGGNYAFQDNRELPDTLTAILVEFGPGPVAKNGFVLQYSMRLGCRREKRAHSCCFMGTHASLLVDRGRYSIVAEDHGKEKKETEVAERLGIEVLELVDPVGQDFCVDVTKARYQLGYQPQYDIRGLIDHAIQFRLSGCPRRPRSGAKG